MGGGEGARPAELDVIKLDVSPAMEDTQDRDLSILDAENHCCAMLEADASQVSRAVDHCPSVREQVET